MTRAELASILSASFGFLTEIQCLSGAEFKAKMSHVVKDLAEPVGGVQARYVCKTPHGRGIKISRSSDFAGWVYDVYRNTGR